MKKILVTCACCIAFLPGLTMAGYYFPGWVYVDVNKVTLSGYVNVRYNGNAGAAFLSANLATNGVVTLSGRDKDNRYFSCTILPSSSLHELAKEVVLNLGNGAYISTAVAWGNPGGACSRLSYSQTSFALD